MSRKLLATHYQSENGQRAKLILPDIFTGSLPIFYLYYLEFSLQCLNGFYGFSIVKNVFWTKKNIEIH